MRIAAFQRQELRRATLLILLLSFLMLLACEAYRAGTPANLGFGPIIKISHNFGLDKPELTIINKSDRSILVTLAGPENKKEDVKPLQNKTIILAPGAYRFEANAPGFDLFRLEQIFAQDSRYSWTFTDLGK